MLPCYILICVLNTILYKFAHSASLNDWENSQVFRRRLLAVTSVTDGTEEIANPIICLELEELVVFRIWVDSSDRTLSHYPKYQKDHLFNTNPSFDYGDFTMLGYYITETNVTYNSFAYTFAEAGTYVFADAQDTSR